MIGAPMISDKKPEGSLLASGVLPSAAAGEDVSIVLTDLVSSFSPCVNRSLVEGRQNRISRFVMLYIKVKLDGM